MNPTWYQALNSIPQSHHSPGRVEKQKPASANRKKVRQPIVHPLDSLFCVFHSPRFPNDRNLDLSRIGEFTFYFLGNVAA